MTPLDFDITDEFIEEIAQQIDDIILNGTKKELEYYLSTNKKTN
jgi:hypothetical protein